MKKFAELFKKYRLRAEFETIAAFSNALVDKGYHYEDSIFSHWQKGTRTPTERRLLLKIIEIFVEREAVKTITQANEFLSSAGQGYLTEEEINHFPLLKQSVFQVPHEVADFIGREDIIAALQKESHGKTLLIYGQAGVGKTTLAIKVAHILQDQFPDGVLWYRMETSKLKDTLISIAHLLGETLPKSNDTEVVASFIRSMLARKKLLLLFDNVEKESNLHLLLPHGSSSTFVILSRQKDLYLPTDVTYIPLESFTEQEVLDLFGKIFDGTYIKREKKTLLNLGAIVGNLPLAIHVLASQLKQSEMSPIFLLKQGEKEAVSLRNLSYENKNLLLALEVSYANLSEKARAVFLSLGVFEGKDFSVDAIAYMNGLSNEKARIILEELCNASLIEFSLNKKFRIHLMVKKFIAEKLQNPYISILRNITFFGFILFTFFWYFFQIMTSGSYLTERLFSATYSIFALWGGFWGLTLARRWGGFKSVRGRSIMMFSLGLFAQAFGQFSYAIYITFLKVDIPYPSVGEIGYFSCIFFYLYGVLLIAKANGIRMHFALQKNIKTIAISCSVLVIGYILLFQNYVFNSASPLKIFFDFAYPFGDMLYVTLAIITFIELKRMKGNVLRSRMILLIIALAMHLLSDYVFIYQANSAVWHAGQINDHMYFFAYLLMTLGIFRLNSGLSKILDD